MYHCVCRQSDNIVELDGVIGVRGDDDAMSADCTDPTWEEVVDRVMDAYSCGNIEDDCVML